MGGQCSVLQTLKKKLFGNKEFRILICGIDAAGKTTVLYKIKLGEIVTTIPTIGFNVETIDYKGVSFTSWDVGGRDGTRALLRHYYPGTEAIVFVVDSNDRDRIDQAKDELWRIISDSQLKDCPVLIMANKQDLPNALSVTELTDKLELNNIKDKPWHIQPSCAPTGEGLYDGLDWLHSQLTEVAAKQAVIKPFQETKDSLPKQESLTAWFSSFWTNSK